MMDVNESMEKMSEGETNEPTDREDAAKPNQKSHHRKRKRHLFNAIRQQMEFYFSDANLAKDRYLKQLITQDPFVPLSTFLTFNRVKKLATTVEEIEKSLDNSELLELSCDRTRVRRSTDIVLKENVDEYTIYVEALPPTSTIESVKNMFKQFGNVVYVSLPKYRRSGRIKEFAFVEFGDVESIDRCLAAFKEFDGVIDINSCRPDQLGSVKAYNKEQDEIEKEENTEDSKDIKVSPKKDDKMKEVSDIKSDRKRKFDETKDKERADEKSEQDGNDQLTDVSDTESIISSGSAPKKRQRKQNHNETDGSDTKPDEDLSTWSENNELTDCDQADDGDDKKDDCLDQEACKSGGKRRRRRRCKESGIENTILNSLIDEPVILSHLRVSSKADWKRLRNKYLTLQREQYVQIKKEFSHKLSKLGTRILPRPVIIKIKQPFQSPTSKVASSKPIRSNAHNMNFYGANQDTFEASGNEQNSITATDTENDNTVNQGQQASDSDRIVDDANGQNASGAPHLLKKPLFEFEPGVIVKVNFDSPCVDVPDFKAEMRQYPCVQYVDLREGQTAAYVRVDNARSAPTIIKQCAPNRCQILTGEPEMAYWNKITHDREQKLTKVVRVRRSKGKKKLIIAANGFLNSGNIKLGSNNTHIRFDE